MAFGLTLGGLPVVLGAGAQLIGLGTGFAIMDWPISLPQDALIDGYRESTVDPVTREEFEIGPPRGRPLGTRTFKEVSLQVLMTFEQEVTLANFYENTLDMGTTKFTWKDMRTQLATDYKFLERYTVEPVSHNKVVVRLRLREA